MAVNHFFSLNPQKKVESDLFNPGCFAESQSFLRKELKEISAKGKRAVRTVLYARALLLLDAGEHGPKWVVAKVAEALGTTTRSLRVRNDGRIFLRDHHFRKKMMILILPDVICETVLENPVRQSYNRHYGMFLAGIQSEIL